MKHYIAIDWGATSGRVIVAHVDQLNEENVYQEEVHRFAHRIHKADDGHWYWDFTGLLHETVEGLKKAAALGYHYESVGVDTWGVDVVFYDGEGNMIAEPLAYRDPFTTEVTKRFFEQRMSAETLYQKTGIQFMPFNTVFKLFGCRCTNYGPYMEAKHILFLPDAVSYYLTGQMVCEYTDLSTSAMMNPRTKEFDSDILAVCGLKREQFPEIVFPGHDLGTLKPEIIEETGLNSDCRVVAVAGHDTASAVAACPCLIGGKRTAYLSCGTWSLMGIVTDEPVITDESARYNFTNEGGVDGTTRLLKNITGMWILEQCRKEWAAQGKEYSYPELVQMAQSVKGKSKHLFNPDEPRFANPPSMLAEVVNGAEMSDAEIIWAIYNSMARRYGEVFRMMQSLAPWPIGCLYVIGGGVQNKYLLELTEKAVGVPVIAGPSEATAIGNIMVQHKHSIATAITYK